MRQINTTPEMKAFIKDWGEDYRGTIEDRRGFRAWIGRMVRRLKRVVQGEAEGLS